MSQYARRRRSGSQFSERPLVLPAPPLANERVVLRPWELADAPVLVAAWKDPEILHFSEAPARREQRDAEIWIAGGATRRLRRTGIDLVITSPGAKTVLGEVGLWNFNEASNGAMLSYWLLTAHRGKGTARAAVELVSNWAMSQSGLGLDLLVAKIDRDNDASERLIRALGFRLERNDTDGHRLFTRRLAVPETASARAK